MFRKTKFTLLQGVIISSVGVLLVLSNFILRSISPSIFPNYYIYIVIALALFLFLLKVDFEIFETFSLHLYVLTISLLIITLALGQVTRGAIRWIPVGSLTLQPSEIFRPFILLYLAKYATEKEIDLRRFLKLCILFSVPFALILIQPSLGVALVTGVGFLGVIFASTIEKKVLLLGILFFVLVIPFSWFLMAPYQKDRIVTFLNPYRDPQGSGYNSIQSTISVGSGRIFGRGLGQGVQTQLAFLPEKHTDFIFAATAEELGFLGAGLILLAFFCFFMSFIKIIENPTNICARAYVASSFLVFLAQTTIHVGMNMGLVPITGLPLPFVSAGGSALLGSFLSLGIALKVRKD